MILVISFNAIKCRFYHYVKHPAQLTLFKEIDHPDNKLKNTELNADGPGHYHANDTGRGSFEPEDTKKVHIDDFCREIAVELNKQRNTNEYDKLVIIAGSHIYGILLDHLDKNVKKLIIHSIQKDLSGHSNLELLHFLQEHTKYSD